MEVLYKNLKGLTKKYAVSEFLWSNTSRDLRIFLKFYIISIIKSILQAINIFILLKDKNWFKGHSVTLSLLPFL